MEVSSSEKKTTERSVNPLFKSSNISELLRVAKAPNLNIDISKLSTQGLLLEKAKKVQEMKREFASRKKPTKTDTDDTRNKDEILRNQTGICKIANKFNILDSKMPSNIEVLRKFSLRLSNKKIFKKNNEEEKEKNITEKDNNKENIVKDTNLNYLEKDKNNNGHVIKKTSTNINLDEEETSNEIKVSNTINNDKNHQKLYINAISALINNNNNRKYKNRKIKLTNLEKQNSKNDKILEDEFKQETLNKENFDEEELKHECIPNSTKELLNLLEEKTVDKNICNDNDNNFNLDQNLNISGVSWNSNGELNDGEGCGEIYPEEIFNKDEILGKAESEIFNFEEENHENEKSPLFAIEYETVKDNYSIKQCNTVLEYSFREDQNINAQITMEDKSKSIENFNNNKNQILFEIFDGFGGDEISNFLQHNFTQIYKQFLEETQNNIPQSLIKSFKEADDEIKNILNVEGKSSTGTIVHIIWESPNKLMVYTANVGNTRVSLISPSHIIKLSQEEMTPETMQKDKIKNIADYIKKNKIRKVFGNYIFELDKNNQKISENLEDEEDARTCCIPFISKIQIDLKIKNQFIFLASNGVWDKINEKEIQQIVRSNNNTEQLCSIITKNVLYKDSPDNISVFSIRLT